MTLDELRALRNQKLADSDWAELSTELSKEEKQAWQVYRQALRNIPNQLLTTPDEAKWPEEPS